MLKVTRATSKESVATARRGADTSGRIVLCGKPVVMEETATMAEAMVKTYNYCGRKGHLKSGYWKKHPEKAPQWWRDLQAKGEAAGGSVEIMVASVEADFAQARL